MPTRAKRGERAVCRGVACFALIGRDDDLSAPFVRLVNGFFVFFHIRFGNVSQGAISCLRGTIRAA